MLTRKFNSANNLDEKSFQNGIFPTGATDFFENSYVLLQFKK